MRIGILAYEGCLAAEVFVFSDLLLIANRVARQLGTSSTVPFQVSVIASSTSPVRAAGGFAIGAQRWHQGFDQLVVPGFELMPSDDLGARLARWHSETSFIRAAAERDTPIASVCVGAFLLGEAGLLDGRSCTTSWLFASELALRYPRSTVRRESLIVHDRPVTTTAAFSAALDLATALIREHLGADIARATARITLVAENRTSQAPYIVESMLPANRGPFAREVENWLVDHLSEGYDLTRLAAAFQVSTRTLLRRFRAQAGESPLTFLQRARVRAAKRLLETTDHPLGEILKRVGYQDAGTFRRLFIEQVGVSVSDYRRQFRTGRPTPASPAVRRSRTSPAARTKGGENDIEHGDHAPRGTDPRQKD
ncbi:GlxA family transcriptional regulator [Streptomyces albipurpureus]|uniref:Helix-turn-helix domain-containing protein n=1 Tax=Streptomyces albipurpureus TaxID=2897419 RepID=A0ABT0UPJ0_9ACTN|nr:helix-turn-helix domain-containing protein [Streptomyces sp. CWNU-1]MCM2390544.1 helix-turn-helix domain-containing protein [Streptomyces sp. CWNU-1]